MYIVGKRGEERMSTRPLDYEGPDTSLKGKRAVTRYRLLEAFPSGFSLVSFSPLTGRRHQIRVHAAEMLQTPVVGDFKYAAAKGGWSTVVPRGTAETPMFLHCEAMAFSLQHPTGPGSRRQVQVQAPLPLHFEQALERLRLNQSE